MEEHDELTRDGSRKLGEFFSECLRLGWKKTDLDWLEALWLKHHDANGRVAAHPLEPRDD